VWARPSRFNGRHTAHPYAALRRDCADASRPRRSRLAIWWVSTTSRVQRAQGRRRPTSSGGPVVELVQQDGEYFRATECELVAVGSTARPRPRPLRTQEGGQRGRWPTSARTARCPLKAGTPILWPPAGKARLRRIGRQHGVGRSRCSRQGKSAHQASPPSSKPGPARNLRIRAAVPIRMASALRITSRSRHSDCWPSKPSDGVPKSLT